MSQSPLDEADTRQAGEYFAAIDRWSRLVQAGSSHSGHERNCAFLNLDGSRFAAVAAVSGLDFDDDARAIVPVDWDHDGDLDLWLSNRTGPQLRLMRNDAAAGYRAVALRLSGESVNRDAIGARVELLAGGLRRSRELRAGAGFLSQGSKWLHFGLGEATKIDTVVVHWPGAASETFGGVAAGGRYRLVQGAGVAGAATPREVAVKLTPSAPVTDESTGRAGIRLASSPPAPVVPYLDWEGRSNTWAPSAGRPRLLNLWASWCGPCAEELGEFGKRRRELNERDLEVLALSVDGLGDERGADPASLRGFLKQLDFPYDAGTATPEVVDKFELLFTRLFGRHRTLPVPVSFLIDGSGQVAAIYTGRVDVDTLLADIDALGADEATRRTRATPFSGTWLSPPRTADLSLLAREYLRAGYAVDAEPLLRDELERTGASETRQLLATSLTLLGKNEEAEKLYRQALAANPASVRANYNLAMLLAGDGRHGDAVGHLESVLRIDPDHANAHVALADALLRTGGSVQALDHYRSALKLRPGWGRPANALMRQLAAGADERVRDVPAAVMLAQEVCRSTNFEVPEFMDTLAIAYAADGRFEEAVDAARKAVELARGAGRADYAAEVEGRLESFSAGRAWEEPF